MKRILKQELGEFKYVAEFPMYSYSSSSVVCVAVLCLYQHLEVVVGWAHLAHLDATIHSRTVWILSSNLDCIDKKQLIRFHKYCSELCRLKLFCDKLSSVASILLAHLAVYQRCMYRLITEELSWATIFQGLTHFAEGDSALTDFTRIQWFLYNVVVFSLFLIFGQPVRNFT